jgi:hypothetical protein
MESHHSGNLKPSELAEELRLVESSLKFTMGNIRYFPCDNGLDLANLTKRRADIVEMLARQATG